MDGHWDYPIHLNVGGCEGKFFIVKYIKLFLRVVDEPKCVIFDVAQPHMDRAGSMSAI